MSLRGSREAMTKRSTILIIDTYVKFSDRFVRAAACLLLTFSLVALCSGRSYGQHTSKEIGFSMAYAGQAPFISSGNDDPQFFTKPLIWNIRYQVATNYAQSLSVVLESVTERRNYSGLWPYTLEPPYPANIAERLTMTTLGLEGIKTIIRTDEFRLGLGISLGYGFGGATANVKKIIDGSTQVFESTDSWSGFEVSLFMRGRVTVYSNAKLDIGITGTARVWGFPSVAPLTESQSSYNGPTLRSVLEVGYLAGVSVGLK
jgi:hypothetical protein